MCFSPTFQSSGLYYKPMTIVNDDARVVNKLEASLIDDTRVVIYDRHMFIVQATGMSEIDFWALTLKELERIFKISIPFILLLS